MQIPDIKTTPLLHETGCPVNHCLSLGETAAEQYPNLIVVANQREAGLLDRLIFINHVLNVASMLCARVHIASPAALLTSFHNNNTKVPKDLDWQKDFVSFAFFDMERSPAINNGQKLFPRKVTTPFVSDHSLKVENPRLHSVYRAFHNKQMSKGKRFNLTSTVSMFLNDKSHDVMPLAQLFKMLQQQKRMQQRTRDPEKNADETNSFVWEIKCRHVYKCLDESTHSLQKQFLKLATSDEGVSILPYLPDFLNNRTHVVQKTFFQEKGFNTCGSYVYGQFPTRIIRIAQLVLRKATERAGNVSSDVAKDLLYLLEFGFLHLRRGDSTDRCDTSLQSIHKYLMCSLGGPQAMKFMSQRKEQKFGLPFVLFLASEEKEQEYRSSVMATIEEVSWKQFALLDETTSASPPVVAVDLDSLIRIVVEEEIRAGRLSLNYRNNYSIFWIGRALGQMGSFMFKRRRELNCDPCNRETAESGFSELLQQDDAFLRWWGQLRPKNGECDSSIARRAWMQKNRKRKWEKLQVLNDLLLYSVD